MKNTNLTQNKENCFKYKFSPLLLVLSIIVILLCIGGIGASIYRIVVEGVHGLNDALQSPLLILLCLVGLVLMISILAKSQYVVGETHYIAQFGFIKSKFLIKDITAVVLNTDEKRLTVYMGEQYTILSTFPDDNEKFAKTLQKVNPNIDFSFTLSDTFIPPKNNKK